MEQKAREIAQFANPVTKTFPGIDHSVCNNMYDITEQIVIDFGPIHLFIGATPCGDFSKLRLLPSRNSSDKSMRWNPVDPRPGLDGPNGAKFRQLLLILSWVLKHNPDCEYFIENLYFDDLQDDWKEICSVIGVPIQVNAQDYSRTKRNRAYWHNFKKEILLPPVTDPPLDPNDCMLPGRTVLTYRAGGRQCVRPIGKSWRGFRTKSEIAQGLFPDVSVDKPIADTKLPVLVRDEKFQDDQHLVPIEAEGLMGMRLDSTAAPGMTALDRLVGIGNGWDIIVSTLLLSHSDIVQNQTRILDGEDTAQQALVQLMDTHGPAYVAGFIESLPAPAAEEAISLLVRHYVYHLNDEFSVVDSGSAKHLSKSTYVLESENRSALTGFDGSMQWTSGNGYLPISVQDCETGVPTPIDINDVDLMSGELMTNILSLGKLLRCGFSFQMIDADNCWAVSPGGANRIKLQLGRDDILRMPHSIRSGSNANRIPVLALRRSADDGTYMFMHMLFNHSSPERIFRTLEVTNGYKAVRFKSVHCKHCSIAKARSFGLKKVGQSSNTPAEAPVMPVQLVDPTYDDDTSDDNGSDVEGDLQDVEYVAEVAGRQLGQQPVPRFNLSKLRLWEVMFVDNKDYPCKIRGGAEQALLFICCKSRFKMVIDVTSKKHNGQAFSRVVSAHGIHKVEYPCRVYTDGCGSMVHVMNSATKAGIDHAYIPPHEQSLNEAEKVADRVWESARAHMTSSGAPDSMFGLCVQFVCYVDARMATTESRKFKTPFEIARGLVPDVSRMHRWWTRCYVTVPKSKRRALAKKGIHNTRAEPGRLVGWHSMFSSTYAVILDGTPARLVHSINVTFEDENCSQLDVSPAANSSVNFDVQPAAAEEANSGKQAQVEEASPVSQQHSQHNLSPSPYRAAQNPLWGNMQPYVSIPAMPPMPALPEAAEAVDNDPWGHGFPAGDKRCPTRQSYLGQMNVNIEEVDPVTSSVQTLVMNVQEVNTRTLHQCMEVIASSDHNTFSSVCHLMAQQATKDIDWKEALAGPEADKAIAALHAEMDSLCSTILTKIEEDNPEFQEARRLATPGRILLDIKRSDMYKARGVKQGFREDKVAADGPDFNYYAHVAQLTSVRASLFRYKRGTRRVALQDVRTAFLQSDPYPPGTVKYICFKNPLTLKWEYYRQSAPIYGEASAPKRWEDTIAPFLGTEEGSEKQLEDLEDLSGHLNLISLNSDTVEPGAGMIRGCNEPCCFLHPTRELLALLYVDDCLADGAEDDIKWLSSKLSRRFDCKDLEWVEPHGPPLDHLGINISQDDKYLYTSMEVYILKCLKTLEWEELRIVSTPIDEPIDTDSPELSPEMKHKAMTAIGMLGWLSVTVRCDVTFTHSRIAQHQSKLTESVMQALQRCFAYLKGTADLGIRSPLYHDYESNAVSDNVDPKYNCGWEFFVDSDFMGNAEIQNKSRSQTGYICMNNGAPVMWASKVTSVAMADKRIGEAHADMSSAAAEVYAAGNASMDFMYLNHVMEEMDIPYPQPYKLQIDNAAAKTFAKNTAGRTKLKHIDARLDWVKTLRNSGISEPVSVPGEVNLGDMLTKILGKSVFLKHRNRCLHRVPSMSR